MPCRNRDSLGKLFPSTHTTPNNRTFLFFGGYELEEPLGEKPKIFEELTREEEEEKPITSQPMAENRNNKGNRERVEGALPIREANGDTKMKNICLSSLPHFHGLTTKDPDTFLCDFVVIC